MALTKEQISEAALGVVREHFDAGIEWLDVVEYMGDGDIDCDNNDIDDVHTYAEHILMDIRDNLE